MQNAKHLRDKNSLALLDDYVKHENEDYETEYWTQVCQSCAKKYSLPEDKIDKDAGNGICGILKCNNEADHYYDFDIQPKKG